MIKAVLTEEPTSTFMLIYGNKTEADTIFKAEIDALQKKYSTTFNVQYVYSKTQHENALFGRIDKGNINFVVKNKPIVTETLPEVEVVIENEEAVPLPQVVQMEEGTVIHNGQPKKFNKKMSAYMIDMLTSEE